MKGVDPQQLEFVLGLIKDGFIFEKFASDFLSAITGYNFIPQGGLSDNLCGEWGFRLLAGKTVPLCLCYW